jgi:hypothetical protein
MTDEKFWNKPLAIAIGSVKYIVRSTREAAWLLADKWPILTGEAFVCALKACAAVLEGKRPVAYARMALITAAKDANLQVEG